MKKYMTIGVDGNEANVAQKVGVSIYSFELLCYFFRNAHYQTQFVVYLRDKPRADLPLPSRYFQYRIVKGNFLWSQLFLPLFLFLKRDIDLFFSPAHYAPRFCPVPTVVTIHDLSYFYYPDEFLKKDLYQLQHWTQYSIKKASKIIAVSQTTKKDLMKFYHLPSEKIEVIYNGFQQSTTNHTTIGSKPYILYIGTIQPRKNLATLINAFRLLIKDKPEYSLVIVGKKGWLYEKIFYQVKTLNLQKKVHFTGYVSDEEKAGLYTHASIFILPSLYEGFGIPLLEAMSFGCPVIASHASSLSEIGDDACLYFDPNNPKELKEKMTQVIENNTLRKELVKRGKKRVQLFSWEKCGEETLHIIKKII